MYLKTRAKTVVIPCITEFCRTTDTRKTNKIQKQERKKSLHKIEI